MPNHPQLVLKNNKCRTATRDLSNLLRVVPTESIKRSGDEELVTPNFLVDHVKPSVECDDGGWVRSGLARNGVSKTNVAIMKSAVFKEMFDAARKIWLVFVELEDGRVFFHNV